MLDMVLWQELIAELLNFLILKLGETAVQSNQQPGKFDVEIQLFLVLNIVLHSPGEISSPWADLCSMGWPWPFRCLGKYFIRWPFPARTGCVRILKSKIIPELTLSNENYE